MWSFDLGTLQGSKWTVMSPELMKKEKQRKAKEKCEEKKRKREKDNDDNDNDTSKRKKKDKHKAEPEDLDYPIVPITGYIHFLKPVPTLPPRTCMKQKDESLYISRGPCRFMSDCSFDEFVSIIAKALPCPPDHIVLEPSR